MASLDNDDYYLTQWRGLDNWQCRHCPFATVNGLDEMLRHLQNHLPAKGQLELPEIVSPELDEEE